MPLFSGLAAFPITPADADGRVDIAGLRRLVRNLSVTDEKSGLPKRASYLDLALAEAQRATQQATPFTILLMHFGRSAAMIKESGEPAVEATMEQVGQLFTANIRSIRSTPSAS